MSAVSATPSVEEVLAAAERAAKASDWGRAADLLADAPEQVRVLDKRAFYLSRAKRYEESRQVLAVLRAREPANFLWAHMTGYQYYEEERYAEAVPWLLDAYRLNPTHLRNLYRLAQTRLHLGDVHKAKHGAGEVLRIWHSLPAEAQKREERTLAKASYLLGREQLKTDAAWAVDLLLQAAEHDPGDHDKHYRLGKALRKAGRARDAIEPLRRSLRIKPGQTYVELELAATLARCDEGEDASRLLAKVERRLNDWQALKGAALAARLHDGTRARRLLERAARKPFVRRSSAYAAVAEQVNAQPVPEDAERCSAAERCSSVESSCGRVDKISVERGYGFLVDEADGSSRYFKLPRKLRLRRGDIVIYRPREADKGPAADVLRRRD